MVKMLYNSFIFSHCLVSPKIPGTPIPPLKSTLAPPLCKTFEDMKETVIPALISLGPSLHYDPILMYKVSTEAAFPLKRRRLGYTLFTHIIMIKWKSINKTHNLFQIIRILKTARSLKRDPLHHEALTVLDAAILPALTLMEGNCCMAEEIYTLIKLYPYQCR